MTQGHDDDTSPAPGSAPLHFGDFTLDPRRFELRRGPELVHLQPKTFDLLHCLLRHADRVVEKDELLATVWPDVVVTEHSLTRCVKDLRKALDDDAGAPRYIETVARRGYRMLVQPQARAAEPEQPAAPTELATATTDGAPVVEAAPTAPVAKTSLPPRFAPRRA